VIWAIEPMAGSIPPNGKRVKPLGVMMKVVRELSKIAAGSAFVAAAAFAGAGSASADGMPSRGPAVVYEAPSNWSGFYFGVQSGWTWSSIDTTYVNGGGIFHNSWDHDTPTVGAQIGLQHQFGQIVLGVEGDVSSAFRDRDAVEVCPNPVVSCHARFDDVLTAGGRLGYAMGKWMPYIAGGYANGAFSRSTVNPATGSMNDLDHARHGGWYAGGGVDMLIAPNWTMGLEYRHYEFDTAFHLAHTPAGSEVFGSDNNMDASSDSINLRVSWKFGRPEAAPLK
jgi:outer membrane immunogenic protein